MINLSKEEYFSRKFRTQFSRFGLIKNFKEAESCGANIIEQKRDGSCFYLKNNKCSIHNERPGACKDFFCTSKNKAFNGMISIISKEKLKHKPHHDA
jgi:Fe-S-cluster containining protein